MSILQHFIIDGKYFGQSERQLERVHETYQVPWSLAFFCPDCGEVWARCPVTVDDVQQKFRVLQSPCKKHQALHWLPAGSLTLSYDEDFSNAFPFEVLQRELLLYLDWAEQT
jgi:hypothetical protein